MNETLLIRIAAFFFVGYLLVAVILPFVDPQGSEEMNKFFAEERAAE